MRQLRGFVPWVIYPLAVAVLDWRLAAGAALLVAAVALAISRKADAADMFVGAAVVFFAGIALVALADPASPVRHYVGALTPAMLAVAALLSIAMRKPFTIPFAKRVAPPEIWDTPIFLHVNMMLTAVWATSFAAMAAIIALVLALHPQAVGIIIAAQVAGFVIPMRISRTYPASVRARYATA